MIIAYYELHYVRTLAAIIRYEPHIRSLSLPLSVCPALCCSHSSGGAINNVAREHANNVALSLSLCRSLAAPHCARARACLPAVPWPAFLFTFLPQYVLIS